MATIARLVGGAGTGKTTELLRLMEEVLSHGVRDPFQIGFVSFTTAARAEAASRASDRFNVPQKQLEANGWFRTLHSVCYKCLGIGKELLADDRTSQKWVEAAVGGYLTEAGELKDDGEDYEGLFSGESQQGKALSVWDTARARLTALATVYGELLQQTPGLGSLEYCVDIVNRYEQAKRLHGRLDFTDLLGQFGGVRFTTDGPERVEPRGFVPSLPVWFLDEQQDTSALLDLVCQRLISAPGVKWVYTAGDPFQSIYGFCGSDSRFFTGMEATKQRVMPKSYRCAAPILGLGESILKNCSDYWDRGIAPADHKGGIERADYRQLASIVNPLDEWLVLARSNFHARRIISKLNDYGIPWVPTKGVGNWVAPKRNAAFLALAKLQRGDTIDGADWAKAISQIPIESTNPAYGGLFLLRGTKTTLTRVGVNQAAQFPALTLANLHEAGATPLLVNYIAEGQWRNLTKESKLFYESLHTWGEGATMHPNLRVGTIHSAKGAEADNVAVLTATSKIVHDSMGSSPAAFDEERRVWYVAATRARSRLVIADDPNASYREHAI